MFFTTFILNKKWYPRITLPFYFLTLGLFIFISVYFDLFDKSEFSTEYLKTQFLYFFGILFPVFFNGIYLVCVPSLKSWYSKNMLTKLDVENDEDKDFVIFSGYWLYLIILKYYLILLCLHFYAKTFIPLIIVSLMDIWVYIIFAIVDEIKRRRNKKRRELEAGINCINKVFNDNIYEL